MKLAGPRVRGKNRGRHPHLKSFFLMFLFFQLHPSSPPSAPSPRSSLPIPSFVEVLGGDTKLETKFQGELRRFKYVWQLEVVDLSHRLRSQRCFTTSDERAANARGPPSESVSTSNGEPSLPRLLYRAGRLERVI